MRNQSNASELEALIITICVIQKCKQMSAKAILVNLVGRHFKSEILVMSPEHLKLYFEMFHFK